MTNAQPISIREHGARPHQRAQGDGRTAFHVREIGVENLDGVTVVHVQGKIPLTPKGAALIAEFNRKQRGVS